MKINAPFTYEQIQALRQAFYERLTPIQKEWETKRSDRHRTICSFAHRAGVTWYLICNAFIDALETGREHIYIGLNKTKADDAFDMLKHFVYEVTGIRLKKHPIVFSNGATINCIGADRRTWAGLHGCVSIDGVLLMDKNILKIASAVASHKRNSITEAI